MANKTEAPKCHRCPQGSLTTFKASLSRPCLPVGLRNPGSEVSVFLVWWSKKSNQVAVRVTVKIYWLTSGAAGTSQLAGLQTCGSWHRAQQQEAERLPVLSGNPRPVGLTATEEDRNRDERRGKQPGNLGLGSYKNDAGHANPRSHRLTCRQERLTGTRFPQRPRPGMRLLRPRMRSYGKHFQATGGPSPVRTLSRPWKLTRSKQRSSVPTARAQARERDCRRQKTCACHGGPQTPRHHPACSQRGPCSGPYFLMETADSGTTPSVFSLFSV